jgi:predicted Zn-dependent protease
MLGYCHLQTGSFAAAGTAYELALMGDAQNVTWLEGKTSVLIGMKRHDEADSLLRELIRRDPENLQYWLLQANSMLSKGETVTAARCLEIARRIGPIENEALLLLGNIYLALDLTDRAAVIYAEALDGAVQMPLDMAMKVAGLMIRKGEVETARKIVEVYKPDEDGADWSVEERSRYGMVVAGLFLVDENIEGAIEQLGAVLDYDPFNDHVLYRLAELHLLNGERENAYLVLERVNPESKDGYNTALLRSRLMIEDEAYEDAVRVLQNALRDHPGETLAEFLNQVETATKERRLLGLTVD